MVFKTTTTRLLFVIVLFSLAALPFQAGSAQESPQVLPARSLGQVRVISGPVSCGEEACYTIEVFCPGLAQSAQVRLIVGNPRSRRYQGTILLTTGGFGTFPWAQYQEGPRVLDELRRAGFQTVQMQWITRWMQGASGQLEGLGRLACRPATVARWVYDKLRSRRRGAFCANGNSNGASQIAYMLTQYGLADLFSVVVLDGGPNFSRLDLGCLRDDPANQMLWYSGTTPGDIDASFGFTGGGPCARMDASFREELQEASLAFDDWPYIYPNTMVWFLFGENDQTTTAVHGRVYYEQLIQEGSPLVRMDIVPNTDHIVATTKEGADMIRDILLSECHPR